MPIISCTADSQAGIITVKASGKNLSDDFFAGAEDASARLSITVDNAKYTPDYVPMVAVKSGATSTTQPNNEIWYTSTDGKVVPPSKTNVFGANIVSNTYEDGKGVIKFDGEVTKIGEYAFSNCSSLTSVTIPDSVTEIGAYTFNNCSSLTSITIPDSVIVIGESAFRECSSLTSVSIPDSVTSIGEGAFSWCSSLKAFYGKFASADNRCLIVDGTLNAFAIGCDATSYTIPDSVTEIGYEAFSGCSSLTSV
ncbi:MAG: leucine-rich repeat domain-containing protein, partial [Alistipes sp.]|nr:leucine-rich repeat domain-containing protein [Alistipes sp.]